MGKTRVNRGPRFESRYWNQSQMPWPSYAKPTPDYVHEPTWEDWLITSHNNGAHTTRDLSKSSGDVGSDFWCVRRYYEENNTLPDMVHVGSGANPMDPGRTHFHGHVTALKSQVISNSFFPYHGDPNWSAMAQFGTKAINRTVPTLPKFNLSTAIGELASDGFPKAMLVANTGQRRTRQCVNAGDEYLNVEFGWLPLVDDVRNFAKAVLDRQKILEDYHKNADRWIHREYKFPTELSITRQAGGFQPIGPPSVPNVQWNDVREHGITTTDRKEMWFEASFRYAVPPAETPERMLSDANHLMGARLTPSTLWELAPWSWAADWCSNTGEVLQNASAFQTDALVMRRAFVMRRLTTSKLYEVHTKPGFFSNYPNPLYFSQKVTTVTKARMRATPFGFGLTLPTLTARRAAIMASLGLSRY